MTTTPTPAVASPPDLSVRLNADFIEALAVLREVGHQDLACRLAANAWAALRHTHLTEAQRLESLLHILVRPTTPAKKE